MGGLRLHSRSVAPLTLRRKQRDAAHDAGIVYCTSFRLLWIDDARPRENSLQLPLSRVAGIEAIVGSLLVGTALLLLNLINSIPKCHILINAYPPQSGFLRSSPKLRLTVTAPSPASPVAAPAKHHWKCAICGHLNEPSTSSANAPPKCSLCGVPKSPSAALFVACAACTFVNDAGARTCQVCGEKVPIIEVEEPLKTISCPACTFHNPSGTELCDMCGTRLPVDSPRNDPSPLPAAPTQSQTTELKLSFRSGGQSAFLEKLRSAMANRAWTLKPPPKPTSVPATPTTESGPGITGLLRTMSTQSSQTNTNLSLAFRDLDSLIRSAEGMVNLASTLSSKLTSSDSNSNEALLRSYLTDIGLANPVTKESAGDAYHSELARQLADFLIPLLQDPKTLGMITLTDAYTVYNRARGVSLISPADLRRAAELFASLKVPLELKVYRSGLTVIQSAEASEERVAEKVWSLASSKPKGVTAIQAASVLGVSVAMAGEWLLVGEEKGYLCRDETVEGLRFYENRIKWADVTSEGG